MRKLFLTFILAMLVMGNAFAETVSKTFTAEGAGNNLSIKVGDSFTYSVSGTFVGTVLLQRSANFFTWETVATATGSASGTVIVESRDSDQIQYRFYCSSYTSGSIVTSMTDATGYDTPIQAFKNKNGETIAYTTERGLVVQDLTVTGTATGTGGGSGEASGWTTDSSTKTTTTYNVGVGTTLPATTLDVIGSIRGSSIQAGTGSATISGDSNGNIGIGTVSASNKVAIGSTGGSNFDTNGNLGIGTTNIPSGDKLYVAGQITSTTGLKVPAGAGAGYVLVSNSVGLGTWMTPASVGAGGGSGTINTGTTNRSARYSGTTTLDSSTKIFDDGTNVGIGTIAPRTAVELGVRALNIVSTNVGISSTNPGQVLDVNGAIRSIEAGNSTFAVGGGNVGVGTATPGQILDVFCSAGTCMRAVGLGTTVPQQLCITNGKIGYFNGAWASTCTTP